MCLGRSQLVFLEKALPLGGSGPTGVLGDGCPMSQLIWHYSLNFPSSFRMTLESSLLWAFKGELWVGPTTYRGYIEVSS